MFDEVLKKIRSRGIAAREKAARNYERALECAEFLDAERAYNEAVRSFEPDLNLIKSLEKNRKEILKQLGISVEPQYFCKKCNDSGYIGNKLCACVKDELIKSISGQNMACGGGLCDCKVDIFSDPVQKTRMLELYKNMAAFCGNFPETEKINIIFSGNTGTGKTFLLKNITAEISLKGFLVAYFTAFGLNNYLLNVHLAPLNQKTELFNALIDCDMLIIDDLGTEPVLKNVTGEYLFNVLNERKNLKRHTIIATNLKQDELHDRYGERVFSRLNDKSDTAFIEMNFSDLRTKTKAKAKELT